MALSSARDRSKALGRHRDPSVLEASFARVMGAGASHSHPRLGGGWGGPVVGIGILLTSDLESVPDKTWLPPQAKTGRENVYISRLQN
jgi:hypothetical protein